MPCAGVRRSVAVLSARETTVPRRVCGSEDKRQMAKARVEVGSVPAYDIDDTVRGRLLPAAARRVHLGCE